MRADIYQDREINAPNRWIQSSCYEKKWRYKWQADREREIIAVLEGWEREVRQRAEEVMSGWAGLEWSGSSQGGSFDSMRRSGSDGDGNSLDENAPG